MRFIVILFSLLVVFGHVHYKMGNDKMMFLSLSKKVNEGRFFTLVTFCTSYTQSYSVKRDFSCSSFQHMVGSGAQQVCQGERGEGGDRERGPGGAVAAVSEALTHGLHVVVVGHEVAV